MLRVLLMLWPALIPLLFYAVWIARRHARKARGEDVPPITDKLFITVVATFAMAALSFLVFGLTQKPNAGTGYHPVHYKDGVLIPGGMDE